MSEKEAAIPKQGKHIIMFYSGNCGHCHKIKPAYMKLANQFPKAKMHLCNEKCFQSLPYGDKAMINLEGFPTFCGFDEGKMIARKVGAPGGEEELQRMCGSMF